MVEDITMEEMGGEELPVLDSDTVVPVHITEPRVVLPSLEEWPAMRPPIKGVSKKLEDQVPPLQKEGKGLDDRILE